ncbi:hypothetical protein TNCV_1373061 [Trichonephila clavipes]|uniref:Uncharacterized protein n=1 Tax=Trichonephila clavipes TaxID=2585209 RepID=A0A8X6WGZ4_TRICX|nr:hypothetical protein TNCV_1373061 [Trichonephila clavipes]
MKTKKRGSRERKEQDEKKGTRQCSDTNPSPKANDKFNSERNSNKIWWNNLKDLPMWPRLKAVVEFLLATRHGRLLKHLHRIHVVQAPSCTLCDI